MHFLDRVWHYVVTEAKEVAAFFAASAFIYFLKKLFKGRKKMEKDVQLGNVGDLEVKVAEGKIQLTVQLPGAATKVTVEVEANVLIDKLVASTDNKIDDALGAIIKAALAQA